MRLWEKMMVLLQANGTILKNTQVSLAFVICKMMKEGLANVGEKCSEHCYCLQKVEFWHYVTTASLN